jgi:hypothetical protein
MSNDEVLRAQLIRLLEADDAHMTFEDAVAEFPDEAINARPPNVGYTPWHLVEHLRLTQWVILEYVRNPEWVSPDWPIGYWPSPDATATPQQSPPALPASWPTGPPYGTWWPIQPGI